MSDHEAPPADPDELDFTDDESVVEIGESRYVVGTNGRPNVRRSQPERSPADETGFTAADPANPAERQPPDPGGGPGGAAGGAGTGAPRNAGGHPQGGTGRPQTGAAGQPGGAPATHAGGAGDTSEVDRQSVSRWLASSFDDDGFTYGIDATLHVDGDTTRQRMVSNDVTATFDSLVTWFASNAGPSSPTPEALGLLLVASETTVDVPPVAIKRFAASQGLTASDSIGDLVRAAEDAGGFRIE
ncbi:DUF7500 family protein [Halorubrum kocurii]|uniref:Uncharacterized protein n=1 Tax=Halorubrum kocurii JCM 14978 TaxID=1230456 RepID=M0PB03_9EURY|nr:hypothetical protein [Halorubrum kocurii]EMA67347.1 hypothetical protein C468_02963 [Halorubrum kocurii JCM 14978]